MLLFDSKHLFKRLLGVGSILALVVLSACKFEPLHSTNASSVSASRLSSVGVAGVNNRVGQQVRNHLLFLLNGGFGASEKQYEARLRISDSNQTLASVPGQNTTSGTVTISTSYDLVELASGNVVANGNRKASASYDRTTQVYANERAVRDAENRAAKEVAEALRLAIAADMSKLGN